MGLLTIEDVTHWSIPVNNLEESEEFYGDFLGLESLGRLGNSRISCFSVTSHRILLCERMHPVHADHSDEPAHHSFTVSPDTLVQACKLFHERQVPIDQLIYRAKGFFTGQELYFFDPSGNRLELRNPAWTEGMPEPSVDEIVRS
jgi:extradiol dioxygenase family protein